MLSAVYRGAGSVGSGTTADVLGGASVRTVRSTFSRVVICPLYHNFGRECGSVANQPEFGDAREKRDRERWVDAEDLLKRQQAIVVGVVPLQ
jgi:hypothetical protein